MTASAYLARLAVALPLVLGLLAAGWYAVRRGWIKPPGSATGAPSIVRAVATLALGPGARLVVVEFDGRRLLVASSRHGITLLDPGTPA